MTDSLGRNLPIAIASGVALAAIFLVTLFASPWAFLAFVALIVCGALAELDGALRSRGLRPATPVAVAGGLVMFFGVYAVGPSAQSVGLVLLLLGTLGWALLDPGSRGGAPDLDLPPAEVAARTRLAAGTITGNVGATLLIALWVPFLASFIALLLARPSGSWAVMATVALAVTNDIGAFAFGSRFGRHKLAPRISPAKTWEGFLGGLATVLLIAAVATARAPGFDLPLALALGAGVSVAATLGDLAESLVKRDLGVKDLGRILPGHGGIMDRVDALLFALPVGHFVLLAFGV
ncbi:MAG: phosphatidate cytidylyltransferase [Euzebyales bacterium]|nr:phosphatidate cytidylyltransferase [Euzebyales bacterium]